MDKVKIGNLVTDLHNVLNGYYFNDNDRKKAIRNMVERIYVAGWSDGYAQAEINYDVFKEIENDLSTTELINF